MNDLKNYISPNGEYVVPVSWEVSSTVIVTGVANLEEAIAAVREHSDDIPLATAPEYIDDSYKIDGDTDEDFTNAQSYTTRGVSMDINGNKIKYNFVIAIIKRFETKWLTQQMPLS